MPAVMIYGITDRMIAVDVNTLYHDACKAVASVPQLELTEEDVSVFLVPSKSSRPEVWAVVEGVHACAHKVRQQLETAVGTALVAHIKPPTTRCKKLRVYIKSLDQDRDSLIAFEL